MRTGLDVTKVAEIRAELDRLLASPTFAAQDKLRQFLAYVVDEALNGRAGLLKERTIGSEALGRRVDYDPKTDPIVRVQARRLREKLDEYYAAGSGDARIRITLPKGAYVPEFAAIEHPPTPAAATNRRSLYFTLGVTATLAAAILLAFQRQSGRVPGAARIRPFINASGTYNHAAFSPDGRRIAFDWDGPNYDNTDIYVQGLDSDTPVRLTTSAADEARPAWSADGKHIAFLRRVSPERAAIVIATASGAGEQAIAEIEAPTGMPRVALSPDNATLVTSVPVAPGATARQIVAIDLATGSQHPLTTVPLGSNGDIEAVYSPDGSQIAFLRSQAAAVQDVYVVPAKGGDARRVTADNTLISGLCWRPDSRDILFLSTRDGGYALWSVAANGSAPVRLAATPGGAAAPNISPRGDRLVFSVKIQDENIWRLDLTGKQPPRVVVDSTVTDSTPALSPDGSTLAFRSSRTGESEIWLSDAVGGSPRRLTHSQGGQAGSPDWSPDGRSIAYNTVANGAPHVFLIPSTGGGARRLTSDNGNETAPQWSRDGRSIYYSSNASGVDEIWRKPVAGGPSAQITHGGGAMAQESFDGRWLYFTKGMSSPGLWRQPLAGGPAELVATDLPTRTWGNWRATRKGVYMLQFVWEQPFTEHFDFFDSAAGRVRNAAQLSGIAAPFSAGLAVSPDEHWLYFVQVDHWGVGLYFADFDR
jgi:Tol biopolymer transport system component